MWQRERHTVTCSVWLREVSGFVWSLGCSPSSAPLWVFEPRHVRHCGCRSTRRTCVVVTREAVCPLPSPARETERTRGRLSAHARCTRKISGLFEQNCLTLARAPLSNLLANSALRRRPPLLPSSGPPLRPVRLARPLRTDATSSRPNSGSHLSSPGSSMNPLSDTATLWQRRVKTERGGGGGERGGERWKRGGGQGERTCAGGEA